MRQLGNANDIGISWSPACKPIVLSIFTKSNKSNVKPSNEAVAQITLSIFDELAPHHSCYKGAEV